MDSLLTAHVADVITRITGNDDYFAVADQATALLAGSNVLREAARRFTESVGDGGLPGAVRDALYDNARATWRQECHHPDDGRRTPVEPGCAGCDTYSAAATAFLDALAEQNVKDAADGYSYIFLVAECTVCGDNFAPNDASDLIHLVTEDGESPAHYCGGRGVMLGGGR